MTSKLGKQWVPIACAVWGVLVVAGMALIWQYKSLPGEAASAPATWPVESSIRRVPGRASVVMFAHPKCACTRASIEELAVLMTNAASRADGNVVFFFPSDAPKDWEDSDTRRRAAELHGVSVMTDAKGIEMARFGVKTSGETLVYDEAGKLLYHGGITSARGHAGDNPGLRRVTELLTRGTTDKSTSPTFGCGLAERNPRGAEEGQ